MHKGKAAADKVLLDFLVHRLVHSDDARPQLRHRRHVAGHHTKVACQRWQQDKVHLCIQRRLDDHLFRGDKERSWVSLGVVILAKDKRQGPKQFLRREVQTSESGTGGTREEWMQCFPMYALLWGSRRACTSSLLRS